MSSNDLETISLELRSRTFSALGDPLRLRILDLLAEDARCVCELQEEMAIAPNLLSYHLRVLREAGLLEASRRGRWVDYRLASTARPQVVAALPEALMGGSIA